MSSLEVYHPPARRDWLELMAPSVELAKAIANTDFVPKAFRNNPAAVAAAILYGDEVGFGPLQSLAKIAVIDGRPALYAEAQRALVLQAGHELWLGEATNTRVTWHGRRKDSDETSSVTWTMDDAKRANLAGKDNWRRYPRAMLSSRASAELCRAVFADAIGGLAAIEELEDGSAENLPEFSAQAPEAPSGTRRRRRRAPLSAVTAAEPAPETPAELPPLPGEEGGPSPSQERQAPDSASQAPEPPPSVELITEPQLKRLQATFREAGFEDREDRLAFARIVVRRPVETSRELTKAEAARVIDALENHMGGYAGETEDGPEP